MKELTLEEISLLEEMKSNCLKKGQYIDEKAKDKFKMLCHLEDFGIVYYELLDVIKEVRAKLYDLNYKIKEIHNVPFDVSEIFEIIDLLGKVEKINE